MDIVVIVVPVTIVLTEETNEIKVTTTIITIRAATAREIPRIMYVDEY